MKYAFIQKMLLSRVTLAASLKDENGMITIVTQQ